MDTHLFLSFFGMAVTKTFKDILALHVLPV